MEEETTDPVYYIRLIDSTELLTYVLSSNEVHDLIDEGIDEGILEDDMEEDPEFDEFVQSQLTLVYPMQIKSRINKTGTGEMSYFTPFLSFTANGISSISYDHIMIIDEATEEVISDYQEMVNTYYLSKTEPVKNTKSRSKKS